MKKNINVAMLRLFKAYLNDTDNNVENRINSYLDNSISKGIIYNGSSVTDDVIKNAEKLYGKNGKDWNKTFHKSFATIKDTPFEVLLAQQLFHYITTYGFESLDIYNSDLVYIPYEKLEIPELEEDVPMVVIHQITEGELAGKLMKLLTSGIALSEQTIEDIMTLSDYIPLDRFDEIANREVKIALYDKYNIVPKNNEEFLKYLVYKATGETLLIKNRDMLNKIRNADTETIYYLLSGYFVETHYAGYKLLAEIYNRYKDVFISMKRHDNSKCAKDLNSFINRIAKLSKKYHKPLSKDVFDLVTQQVFTRETLEAASEKVTVYRIIRALNSILFRIESNSDNIIYKIRNGKAFVDEYKHNYNMDILAANWGNIYEILVNRLLKKLNGKTVYMPKGINYMFPQSEKQFNGNIPEGSFIEIPRTENIVIGVNWNNLPKERVDLDLHMLDKTRHFGWNAKICDNEVIYSGDVTDATDGATEVFFISKDCSDCAFLLTLNNYTTNSDDVPFRFMIASAEDIDVDKNYVVNPNLIKFSYDSKFELDNTDYRYQKTLGMCIVTKDSFRFYFNNLDLGNSIATSNNALIKGAYNYLLEHSRTQLTLREVLEKCGVEFTDKPTIEKLEVVKASELNTDVNITDTLYKKVNVPVDYNLSIEALTKESIIDILS